MPDGPAAESEALTPRPAVAEDEPAIRALIKEAGINPLGLDWARFLVVVSAAGELLACGQVKPHRDGSRELASVAVKRAWRGRGLARHIIEALQAQVGPPLWLTCMDRLENFYRQFGFVTVQPAQMPAYFQRAQRWFNFYLKLRRYDGRLLVMAWLPNVS